MVDRNIHEEDIEAWLDALKGRDPLSTSPELLREAKAVHSLLAAHVEKRLVPASEHDVQRFIFRLKKEGLLKPERRISGVFAAVASIGFVALALAIMQPWKALKQEGLDESQVWRGGEDAQRIRTNDPRASAAKVEKLLRDHGLMVRRIEENTSIRLQVKLPVEATELHEKLIAEGLDLPKNGRLDVFWVGY
jgi:hypothetical protein